MTESNKPTDCDGCGDRECCDECESSPEGGDKSLDEFLDRKALGRRLDLIENTILVVSGKGGVGKSTVAVNLAVSLALQGREVGLLDVDIHGPSVPKMLGLERKMPIVKGEGLIPILAEKNLKVMSIGFLLRGSDDPIVWRGPMKMNVIRQFIKDVEWGHLDYLIVDCPPGTGDEPLTVAQLIGKPDGAVVVTTPQELALIDVRRCVNFCRQLEVPVLGIVENMSGYICPACGERSEVFKSGAGEKMAADMNAPFLGRIPLDVELMRAGDEGRPYMAYFAERETAREFAKVVAPLMALADDKKGKAAMNETKQDAPAEAAKDGMLRAAVPVAAGRLAMHFGHCEQFALIDVDRETKEILAAETVEAPDHQPGLLPRWLAERNVNVVIAGGMGQRAQGLFAEQSIEVVIGAPSETPEDVVRAWLGGSLETGANICDH